MKKLSIILLAVSLIAFSCNKVDEAEPGDTVNATMTFDGTTYTEFDVKSLNIVAGMLPAKGNGTDEFLLTIMGIGEDGTTSEICPDKDCPQPCSVMLDFGAAAGKEGFVAMSGTVKRTDKKIEVNVSGTNLDLETLTLTATINVGSVIF